MKLDLIENFWNRINDSNAIIESSWDNEVACLNGLGIGMEETLHYFYNEKPDSIAFKKWIAGKAKKQEEETGLVEDVLTKEDLLFWETNGYLVLKNVIPIEDCLATQAAIWNFLDKKLEDVASWYTIHEEQRGMMVNFFHHSTLEKNRASLKIRKAYEQLYKTSAICKTIDKVSFNPPITDNYTFSGSGLHWDVSLKPPIPFRLQGLLYLSNCNEKEGAFHCVPGFYLKIEDWLKSIAVNKNPREVALQTLTPKAIIGEAGDFVIWNQALPHCATPNFGKSPRMVQYLTYVPDNYIEKLEWI